MQFKVPQFLDIEDRIFGPFTFRQFAYLAGGAGLCYILFRLLGFWLGIIPIALIATLSISLSFYRPNGKPFIYMLQAGLKYISQSKLYIWQKEKPGSKKENEEERRKIEEVVKERKNPRLSGSKLRDLAWSLDVLDTDK